MHNHYQLGSLISGNTNYILVYLAVRNLVCVRIYVYVFIYVNKLPGSRARRSNTDNSKARHRRLCIMEAVGLN